MNLHEFFMQSLLGFMVIYLAITVKFALLNKTLASIDIVQEIC